MKIGDYLIGAVRAAGVRHVFGIQGDYVLAFYARLCASDLTVVNTCDEPGAGFAADAYARVSGFGAVCVTYGVGGLKLANTTAQAFAERSPVLVISGAPGVSERRGDPLLHHKVRSFDTQLKVFREMTVAQAVLDNPDTAASEIERVLAAVKKHKRPGYLELPRDMVLAETVPTGAPPAEQPATDPAALAEALAEVMGMLAAARRPLVVVGLEVHRFGLEQSVLNLLERTGFPFVTGVMGKSVLPETHPGFVGVYAGAMSPPEVRDAVEEADCVLAVGPLVTDLATGMFTQRLDPGRTVAVGQEWIWVRHHAYLGIGIQAFLESVTQAWPETRPAASLVARGQEPEPFVPEAGRRVAIARLIPCLQTFLDHRTTVIAEPGDALFSALDLRVHEMSEFLSPAYYASLGFAVPAAIGVQLADPGRRPLVLVGDGAFQMSGTELSTALRYGLSPIVVILNNGGYGTFRPMVDGPFNDLQPWRYAELPGLIGGGLGFTVTTEDQLASALAAARENTSSPTLIDLRLSRDDGSPRLKQLTGQLKQRTRGGPAAA